MVGYFLVPGDPSAGIPDCTGSFDTGFVEFEDKEEREYVRDQAKNFYDLIHDVQCGIWFQDECGDCLHLDGRHHEACPGFPQELKEGD